MIHSAVSKAMKHLHNKSNAGFVVRYIKIFPFFALDQLGEV